MFLLPTAKGVIALQHPPVAQNIEGADISARAQLQKSQPPHLVMHVRVVLVAMVVGVPLAAIMFQRVSHHWVVTAEMIKI